MALGMGFYILDADHRAIPVDLDRWGEWMSTGDRRVAETMIGDIWISTVFLGIDHNFMRDGDPLLFETMAFHSKSREDMIGFRMRRYFIWDEAAVGHEEMVREIRSELAKTEANVEMALENLMEKANGQC